MKSNKLQGAFRGNYGAGELWIWIGIVGVMLSDNEY